MGEATTARSAVAPGVVVERVGSVLLDGAVSEQSAGRLLVLIERVVGFVTEVHDLGHLDEATPEMIRGFVHAPDSAGEAPSAATMHLRRCAVRILFRVGRQLGLVAVDPTVDLVLPPRAASVLRPLTDDEAALGRAMSVHDLEATRLPAAWALAEAGVRSGELAGVTVGDLDLELSRVWVRGCRSVSPRWARLSPWGRQRIELRVAALGDDAGRSLTYGADGSVQSRQAAACIAVTKTLVAAGLHGEPGVRPLSVTGWAGRRVFEETGRVEDAAQVLGMRSLDRTARLIGVDWRTGAS